MCCNHENVDLSLLHDVLEQYADVKGSLISILQKTQEIYGYIPIDAVYHISERTGLTPAKILGVATWDEPAATLKAIEDLQLPWPQIMNAQRIGSDAYGVQGIPQIILFAPDGKIVARDLHGEELKAAVDKAMQQ
jgi:hypothetical protein